MRTRGSRAPFIHGLRPAARGCASGPCSRAAQQSNAAFHYCPCGGRRPAAGHRVPAGDGRAGMRFGAVRHLELCTRRFQTWAEKDRAAGGRRKRMCENTQNYERPPPVFASRVTDMRIVPGAFREGQSTCAGPDAGGALDRPRRANTGRAAPTNATPPPDRQDCHGAHAARGNAGRDHGARAWLRLRRCKGGARRSCSGHQSLRWDSRARGCRPLRRGANASPRVHARSRGRARCGGHKDRPPRGKAGRAFCRRKTGGGRNVQAIADGGGRFVDVSASVPASVHGMKAFRQKADPAPLGRFESILANPGHTVAEKAPRANVEAAAGRQPAAG